MCSGIAVLVASFLFSRLEVCYVCQCEVNHVQSEDDLELRYQEYITYTAFFFGGFFSDFIVVL